MKKITNRKILVVSPTPSHPQNAGNRSRIFEFLSILKSMGFEIHFLYYNMESKSKHVTGKPNKRAMSAAWDRFYFVPNTSPGILLKLTKLITATPIIISPDLKFNISILSLKLKFFLSKLSIALVNLINHIVILVDRWIGHIARLINKISPGTYKFLRKVFLGNHQSLINRNPVRTEESILEVNNHNEDNEFEIKAENKSDNYVFDIDDWYNVGLDKIVSHLHKKNQYGVVLTEYVFMSQALMNIPDDVLKVIDTHDLFTDRHLKYKTQGLSDSFFSTTRSEEVKGFNRADLLIAIQDNERSIIEKMTYVPAATVGHKVTLFKPKTRIKNRNQILYLGAGNSSNIDGITHFINKVLPLIAIKIPDVKLVLAGNICNHVEKSSLILKLGEVKKVKDAYNEADIVINPGRVGTGLKIKNIESLGFGAPLVCTTNTAEGMDNNNNGFIVAESDGEFASASIKLLQDKDIYNEYAENAINYVKMYNNDIDHRMKLLFCP